MEETIQRIISETDAYLAKLNALASLLPAGTGLNFPEILEIETVDGRKSFILQKITYERVPTLGRTE